MKSSNWLWMRKRQMDELLTEAAVDLLIKKRGRLPKAIEKVRDEQTD